MPAHAAAQLCRRGTSPPAPTPCADLTIARRASPSARWHWLQVPSFDFIHRKSQEMGIKHLVRWVLLLMRRGPLCSSAAPAFPLPQLLLLLLLALGCCRLGLVSLLCSVLARGLVCSGRVCEASPCGPGSQLLRVRCREVTGLTDMVHQAKPTRSMWSRGLKAVGRSKSPHIPQQRRLHLGAPTPPPQQQLNSCTTHIRRSYQQSHAPLRSLPPPSPRSRMQHRATSAASRACCPDSRPRHALQPSSTI